MSPKNSVRNQTQLIKFCLIIKYQEDKYTGTILCVLDYDDHNDDDDYDYYMLHKTFKSLFEHSLKVFVLRFCNTYLV